MRLARQRVPARYATAAALTISRTHNTQTALCGNARTIPRLRAEFQKTLKMARHWPQQPETKKGPQKILRARSDAKFCVWLKTKSHTSALKSSFRTCDAIATRNQITASRMRDAGYRSV